MSKKKAPRNPPRPKGNGRRAPNAIGPNADRARGEPPRWRGQDVVIAERREKALELRRAGASFRQIARKLGVGVDTAWSDVQAEMEALRLACAAGAEDLRALERLRLDRLLLSAMTILEDGNADLHVKVKAIAAAVRVSDRRSRLEGLDAPTRMEHSGKVEGGNQTLLDPTTMTTEELLALRDLVRAQESRDKAAILAAAQTGTTA